MINRVFKSSALALLAVTAVSAAPAAAVRVQLIATGTIGSGTDGGTDLTSVDVINNIYVEHYAPGSVFGTIGSLIGKAITFRTVYETDSPYLPIGAGGVFDDGGNGWTLDMAPTVTIGGISHDVYTHPYGAIYGAAATLGLTDGAPDALSGAFSGFSFGLSTITNILYRQIGFNGTLPSAFFSTNAVLPGDAGLPGRGYANAAASGTGSFDFTAQTCFINCSSKQAIGTFTLNRILFSAAPEPENWALLLLGFGLTGAMARRRRPSSVTA